MDLDMPGAARPEATLDAPAGSSGPSLRLVHGGRGQPADVGNRAVVDTVLRREAGGRGRVLGLTGAGRSAREQVLDVVAARAAADGWAVALARPGDSGLHDVPRLVNALADGPAPVISARSARVLTHLVRYGSSPEPVIEGLLRRHARHRPVLLLIDSIENLDPHCRRVLGALPAALHDADVTWVLSGDPLAPPADGSPGPATARRAAAGRTGFGWEALTVSERRVALLIADGHTNRTAAAALVVSPHTVSTHLRAVFAKLDVNSRVQMTRIVLARRDDQEVRAAGTGDSRGGTTTLALSPLPATVIGDLASAATDGPTVPLTPLSRSRGPGRPPDPAREEGRVTMDHQEHDLLSRVSGLVEREHQLREQLAEPDDVDRTSEQADLERVEQELDQCWDLLRQRRALQAVGRDPDEAHVRPVEQVENYLPRSGGTR